MMKAALVTATVCGAASAVSDDRFTQMRMQMMKDVQGKDTRLLADGDVVSHFNDLTYDVSTIYYAKKMNINEEATVYEDDTWSIVMSCEIIPPHLFHTQLKVSATNNNDFAIEGLMEGSNSFYGIGGASNTKKISPHGTVVFNSLNKPHDYSYSSGYGPDFFTGSGSDSALLLSDGHFISNHGEASIVYLDLPDRFHRFSECGMAGFLQLATPIQKISHENNVDDDNVVTILDAAAKEAKMARNKAQTVSKSQLASTSTSSSASGSDMLMIAAGALLGGFVTVFISLKSAGFSLRKASHSAISMDESTRSTNNLPPVEY